jgi:hypothetical protein
MYKITILFFCIIVNINPALSQNINFAIKVNKPDSKEIEIRPDVPIIYFEESISSLFIKCTTSGNEENTFNLFFDGKKCDGFKGKEFTKALKCAGETDLRDKKIEVKDGGETKTLCQITFRKKPTFEIKVAKGGSNVEFNTEDGKSKESFASIISSVYISNKLNGDNSTYKLYVSNSECASFLGNEKDKEVSCTMFKDLRGKTIQIRDESGKVPLTTFTLSEKESQTTTNASANNTSSLKPKTSAIDEIKKMFPLLLVNQYGLQIPNENKSTAYTGDKYVHIFLDQFGNNLFSTIPQGISNRQYIVHILYLENSDNPNDVSYSVNQIEGEYQDALVFNNSGQLGTLEFRSGETINYKWAHKEYLLSTSTTNIKFEVVRTSLKNELKNEFESQSLKTYTIKMSKVYHGSFDVGLINSTLENPTFELVTSPTNSAQKVVKINDGSNRGVVTVMATFYTSPIILLESLFSDNDIPRYKLSGRNFLDDHKIYERIYPAIGVGFTDKTLENLFFGFNWEFARGCSIFAGWHYGKVNIYNAPDNFKYEETPVTSDEFNLKKNTAWKTSFAIGLNLDIMIIKNLFRPANSGSGQSSN